MTKSVDNKVATRGQRRKIRRMLDGDRISFELAQALIEGKIRIATDAEIRLVFWEKMFPGKGEVLREALEPFYNWDRKMKSVLPDLEERAKNAVFWEKTTGVSVYRYSNDRGILDTERREQFVPIEFVIRIDKILGHDLRSKLWDLSDVVCEDLQFGDYRLWSSFRDTIYMYYGYLYLNELDMALKFKPLLDLWLMGNFPVNIDNAGKLVVLAQDTNSPICPHVPAP